jgi:tetratricopeptide (TPR) repeat protein
MKSISTLILFFTLRSFGFSQSDSTRQINDTIAQYSIVDEMPAFPGGDSALIEFISKNTRFQGGRGRNILTFTFTINFVVTKFGKLKNIKVTEGDKNAANMVDEFPRVFRLMPDWIPGKEKSELVNVLYSLQIFFSPSGFYIEANNKNNLIADALSKYTNNYQVYDVSLADFYNSDKPYENGVKNAQSENYVGAIKDFTLRLKYHPNDIDALFNRGVCKFKVNDKEGACTDWNAIKALGKDDADKLLSKHCENK